MLLHIKNMVCHRCKLAVAAELEKLSLHPVSVSLGEVVVAEDEIDEEKMLRLREQLEAIGFELLDDKRSQLIEQIKVFIIDDIHHAEDYSKLKLSTRLAEHFGHDYSYLSNLFSEIEGVTIEHFAISQRIEKVKELITYDELSLAEIAYKLDYSSPAHLSSQFKKMTGLTPSQFRKSGANSRRTLDSVSREPQKAES